MNSNKALLPLLRFPEFVGKETWEDKILGFYYKVQGGFAFKSSDFKLEGIPVIRISNIPIDSLYVSLEGCVYYNPIPNDNNYVVENGDLLIAMSGATTGKTAIYNKPLKAYINQRVGIFRSVNSTNYYQYICHWVNSESFHKQLKKLLTAGTQPNISSNDIESLLIQIPDNKEQQKISNCITSINDYISATHDKLKELEKQKRGLIQILFPQKGKCTPEYRFPEFKDSKGWEEKKLGDYLFEHKTKSDGKCQVYSVSVSKGVVNQIDYLGRSFSASDTSNYKLVKPYDVIYTKSPTGDFPFGIVKQSQIEHNVIVSPLYGVFSPKNKYIGYIIHSFFESPERTNNYLYPYVQKGAKNTIQISNNVFLSGNVCFPSNEGEQQKIALCLSSMDVMIKHYINKIDQLWQYKTGLLQQLFPKQ